MQLLEAEEEAGAPGEKLVSQVRDALLRSPFGTGRAHVLRQVRAFGEDQQPHRIQPVGAGHGPLVAGFELVEPVFQTRFVREPFPGHEDEAVEHHARAQHRDVLERLLQDDEDVSVHPARVRYPPEIQPLGVHLVVRNVDQPFREAGLEHACRRLVKLAPQLLIPTHAHLCRGEPVSAGNAHDGERLFGQGHVCVVVVFVHPVQWRPQKLCDVDADGAAVEPCCEQESAQHLTHEIVFDDADRVRFLACAKMGPIGVFRDRRRRLGFGLRIALSGGSVDGRHGGTKRSSLIDGKEEEVNIYVPGAVIDDLSSIQRSERAWTDGNVGDDAIDSGARLDLCVYVEKIQQVLMETGRDFSG